MAQVGISPLFGGTSIVYADPNVLTPEMFGAIGDGVSDDAVALQACFDAVTATGRTIYFDRRYYSSATLNISARTRFLGNSEFMGGIWGGPLATPLINIPAGLGGFRFENFFMYAADDGISTATTSIDSSMENCWFIGAGYMLSGYFSNWKINNCNAEVGGFLEAKGGNYITILNPTVFEPEIIPFLFTQVGISASIFIDNLHVELGATDITYLFRVQLWDHISISNVMVTRNGAAVGRLTEGNWFEVCDNITITNFSLYDCMQDSGANSVGLYFTTGNHIAVNNYLCTHLAYANCPKAGIQIVGCSDISINAQIDFAASYLVYLENCLLFDASVIIKNCQNYGIYIAGTTEGRFNGGQVSICGKGAVGAPLIQHSGSARVSFENMRVNGVGGGTYSNYCIDLDAGSIGRFVNCNFTGGGVGVDTGGAGTLETIHNINL